MAVHVPADYLCELWDVWLYIFRACSDALDKTSKPIFQCLPKQSNNPVVLTALCSQDTWGTAEQQ